MTRLAEAANRTAQPNVGHLARRLQRARRRTGLDVTAAAIIVAVIAWTAAGIVREVPIATGVTLLALLPTALVDLRTSRLPNRGLFAAATAGAVAAAVELTLGSRLDDTTAVDIALSAIAVAGPLLLLHLASPASMGFGDVKLGLVLGLAFAPLDPITGLVALALGGATGALAALLTRQRTIPFGPALLTGAAVATVLTSTVVSK